MSKPKRQNVWKRPVLNVYTGEVYESAMECSRKTGVPHRTVIHCIDRGRPTKHAHFVAATQDELRQWRSSQSIAVGDKVALRDDVSKSGVVEYVGERGEVRFCLDTPVTHCEAMRRQLIKIDGDEDRTD